MTRRRLAPVAALAVVFGVALAVRVVYTVVVDPQVPGISDARTYHLQANYLADGEGFVRPYALELSGRKERSAEFPPLFPAAVALVALAGGRSADVQQLAMCAVGAATVVAVFVLARRVAGTAAAWLAAAVAAAHPMLFQSDAVLMSETLFALLVTAAVVLAYRAVDVPTRRRWAALGAAVGLAALTRGEGLLLLALLVLPVLRAAPAGSRLKLGTVAVVAAGAVLLPWTARNWLVFDRFVPTSHNLGTALAGANCDAAYQGDGEGLWHFACVEALEVPGEDEATAAERYRDAGLRYAGDHAGDLPRLATVRLLRTWGVYDVEGQLRYEAEEGRRPRVQRIGTRLDWVVVPLAAAGAVVLVRRRRRVWPLVAPAVVASVTAVATYGNQRFRQAAEPALVVLAATAVVGAIRHRGPRRIQPS